MHRCRVLIIFFLSLGLSACSAKSSDEVSHRLKVTLKKDTVLVRVHFNQHEDLIEEFVRCGNDNYTPEATYMGLKIEDDATIMRNMIHRLHDSTGPLINSQAPWHLFMQHGYCIPVLTAGNHRLSKADIGSEWKDENGRVYSIGKIKGTDLYLLPKIRKSGIEGKYTRDWKTPYSGYPRILHHISGAQHKDDILIKGGSRIQIRPIQKAVIRGFYADGKEISEYGTYECDEFTITETFSCLNPETVETWFPKPVMKDEMLQITQTMTIFGLAFTYNTSLDVKSPVMFESYGCNQARHLMKYKDYDAYVMLPRVKKLQDGHRVDMPFVQNTKKGKNVMVKRTQEDLYDTDKLPDREISYLYNPIKGYKLGFASGLSLTNGLNADTARLHYIPMGTLAMNMSPANRNKMYVKAINSEAFENGLLPRGFKADFHSYFAYFDPTSNEGQVFWYKDGQDFLIYTHCQTKRDSVTVYVPSILNGYATSVVDKTSGVTLYSKIINNGMMKVGYLTDDANYIVIRANKEK